MARPLRADAYRRCQPPNAAAVPFPASGIPSFIVTVAGMLLFRGLTQIVLEGQSLAPFPYGFQNIAKGIIPEMGPYTQYHNPTLVPGLVAIAFLLREWRDRERQLAYELDVLPTGLWAAKCVAMTAAVVAFTLTLASFHGVLVDAHHVRAASASAT